MSIFVDFGVKTRQRLTVGVGRDIFWSQVRDDGEIDVRNYLICNIRDFIWEDRNIEGINWTNQVEYDNLRVTLADAIDRFPCRVWNSSSAKLALRLSDSTWSVLTVVQLIRSVYFVDLILTVFQGQGVKNLALLFLIKINCTLF